MMLFYIATLSENHSTEIGEAQTVETDWTICSEDITVYGFSKAISFKKFIYLLEIREGKQPIVSHIMLKNVNSVVMFWW